MAKGGGVVVFCLCLLAGGTVGIGWIQKLSRPTLATVLREVGELTSETETIDELRARARNLVNKGCDSEGLTEASVTEAPGGGGICPRIISRDGWTARLPVSVEYMTVPVENVVVQHSFTLKCTSLTLCSSRVSLMQAYYMDERHEKDIAESFLIGGDGNVYEGTGWHWVGNHTKGYNTKAVGISLIGDFRDMLPPARQMEALKKLLRCGVARGELDPDYKLLARRQLSRGDRPGVGTALFLELQTWLQWAGQPSGGL